MLSVLLVTDETWVINDVRAALADTRYAITTTADPRSVAVTTADTTPDVVLVDLQVGSMGGMAVTRSVRDAFSVAGTPPPPVILLLDARCGQLPRRTVGAAGWVRKPFGSAELRDLIEHHTAAAKK
jgi:CheY-like chemotaxis protein